MVEKDIKDYLKQMSSILSEETEDQRIQRLLRHSVHIELDVKSRSPGSWSIGFF